MTPEECAARLVDVARVDPHEAEQLAMLIIAWVRHGDGFPGAWGAVTLASRHYTWRLHRAAGPDVDGDGRAEPLRQWLAHAAFDGMPTLRVRCDRYHGTLHVFVVDTSDNAEASRRAVRDLLRMAPDPTWRAIVPELEMIPF